MVVKNEGALTPAQINRLQLKNKKKKLKKKASKQRKRELQDDPTNGQDHSTDNDSSSDEAIEDMDMYHFELKGPYERFKLIDDEAVEEADETKVPVLHTEINMKARTAALLAAEEAESRGRNYHPQQMAGGATAGAAFGQGRIGSVMGGGDDSEAASTVGGGGASVVNGGGAGAVDAEGRPLSKKRLKLLNRPSVAALKQAVSRPDVVEMWDVCARDPLLLVHLKAYRNTVPVPRHWCAKRKYLQGKRGFEKPPFRLPDFIARTGIMEMRQTVQEKDSEKTMKTKLREKIRPKVGKVDIDYHKLHDAFFKHQTRPRMTRHGDLYYEGKEFEVKLKEKKPGNLTDELKTALGLPLGPGGERYPPPWLIAMQRYGPPPSYPNLKVPGLNAPIPDGCAFGYHPGGWGKPPVDELGRPVYGDVFGNGGNVAGVPQPPPSTPISQVEEEIASGQITYWGELESDEDDDDEDEEEDDDDDDDDDEEEGEGAGVAVVGSVVDPEKGIVLATGEVSGLVTPSAAGLATPSGVSSVSLLGGVSGAGGGASVSGGGGGGLETPGSAIELRKRTIEEAMENSSGLVTPSAQLYRVLPERSAQVAAGEMMGSSKLYDVAGTTGAPRGIEAENPRDRLLRKRPSAGGIDSTQTPPAPATGKVSQSTTTGRAEKKYKDFKF